jgi:hypothetical protein
MTQYTPGLGRASLANAGPARASTRSTDVGVTPSPDTAEDEEIIRARRLCDLGGRYRRLRRVQRGNQKPRHCCRSLVEVLDSPNAGVSAKYGPLGHLIVRSRNLIRGPARMGIQSCLCGGCLLLIPSPHPARGSRPADGARRDPPPLRATR